MAEDGGGRVRVEILGRENVGKDRIEVKKGDTIVWFNTRNQDCTIAFREDGCPFSHDHRVCEIAVPARQEKDADPVQGDVGKEYRFSVQFAEATEGDLRGTPKIIITG